MHLFLSVIVTCVSLLTLNTHAAPSGASQGIVESCLSDFEAQTLANTFGYLTSSWSLNATYSETLANASLTTTLHDYSDSVRTLESQGCTVSPQPVDSTLTAFAADQLKVPPLPLQVLQVWHNCDTVTFRWISKQTPQEVIGLVVLETVLAPPGSSQKRLINTVFSEFNSAAWFVSIGIFKPSNCTNSTS
ncbi:hypothetical protein MMC14_009591 [Varicellaria rhodocarpa]|nr:hypothetical protein [Varicellaria rhodocarpa]